MLPRLLFLLALFCLPATAQRKETPASSANKAAGEAPAVEAQEVKVMRGQSVVITLKGTSSTMRSMTFLIREGPKLGTFKEKGPVTRTDKISATITYTASPTGKGNKDTFTFAAQVPGSSVCEPATVTIHISDTASKLDFGDIVDAKRLVLGQPSERTFLLRNAGNARWEAKVTPPKGWKWVLPADGAFRLEPGAEIKARISCLAQKVGPMEEVIEFAPGRKMTFVAKVVPPFTLMVAGAALQWQKDTRSRTGSVEINNLDPASPLTVQMEGPAWLKTEPTLTVGPDVKAPLLLAVETEHGKALSGKLKITAGSYTEEVNVTAPPSPALLSIIKGLDDRYGFHFGKLNAVTLQTSKRRFTVINEGGAPATVKLQAPEHFRLEPPPPAEGLPLEPGREMEFVLLPPVSAAGTFRSEMNILGGDDTVTVVCSAGVEPADIPPTPGKLAGLILEEDRKARPPIRTKNDQIRDIILSGGGTNGGGGYFSDGAEDEKLPRVDVVEIAEDTGDEVTFAWDLPPGDGWKFRLMRATIQRLKAGNYVKVFVPCGDEVKYTIEGRRATATVRELHPHVPFNFRIQTIAPDGRPSVPGKAISYRPYPPDPTHWQRNREWYAGGLALFIGFGWWFWKKWKQPINAVA
jgi:hypothetical protein